MSARIVAYKDYVAGWLDSSIHDFLEASFARVAGTKYAALITCLDSNPHTGVAARARAQELKSIANKLEVLGTGLLLPTKLLLRNGSGPADLLRVR